MCCRIVVSALPPIAAELFRLRPGLTRKLAVRRIDDDAPSRRRQFDGGVLLEVRLGAAGAGLEKPVEVRLAVRQTAHGSRGGGGRRLRGGVDHRNRYDEESEEQTFHHPSTMLGMTVSESNGHGLGYHVRGSRSKSPLASSFSAWH